MSRLEVPLPAIFAQRKPLNEFLDHTSFSRPTTLNEATQRIRKNIAYFRQGVRSRTTWTTRIPMPIPPWNFDTTVQG